MALQLDCRYLGLRKEYEKVCALELAEGVIGARGLGHTRPSPRPPLTGRGGRIRLALVMPVHVILFGYRCILLPVQK
jgi:hypothetical protein